VRPNLRRRSLVGEERVVGVIGGMGPEATVRFYQRLTSRTPAGKDQEHLHVIIDSNSKIPDRTASIVGGTSATLDAIIESARLLEEMGAQLLAMPCNSAHYYYREIISTIGVPLINMIEEVFSAVNRIGLGRVGLLATTGTVISGVYSEVAESVGLLLPDENDQERVHNAIYSIKGAAGEQLMEIKRDLLSVAEELRGEGAEGVILGCTEIPLLIGQEDIESLHVFDSTEILVDAVLREAFPASTA
jgi:aspartate racemase